MKTPLLTKGKNLRLFACFMVILATGGTGMSQDIQQRATPGPEKRLLEIPDDPYLHSPRDAHPTSPAYRYFSREITTVQVNVDENGNNIVNDAANEPSITFDPNDHSRMVIGWRQFDNIFSNFRQAGYGYTTDGGQTWTFPGVIDPGVFRSDPVLGCDGEGNFYYNSLTSSSGNYWTNVYRSGDWGETWEMGTFAQGGDKQWMAIDRTGGTGAGNIYEFWNGSYSVCSPDNFTRSTNHNESYEECSRIPGDPYWGTTFVGPDGSLYLCGFYWGNFLVVKSSNAQFAGQTVNWDYANEVNLGGEIIGMAGSSSPNPDGLLGQTILTMDSTGGPGDGNLYLLCSIDRYTSIDPCDVVFSRSMDGGMTWSPPVKVNDDVSVANYQWFGTMSVAPDGRIDVIWLDTRDNPGSVNSSLYYTYSLDQGVTWKNNLRLSDSFDPHEGWPQQNKMGDYFDMFSDEDGAHLAWAATFNGEQDVYYSLITPPNIIIGSDPQEDPEIISKSYPNPFRGSARISYRLENTCEVSLKVFTMTGNEVKTLVDETRNPGIHTVTFQAEDLNSGIYYYVLLAGHARETGRLVLLK